MPTSNPQPRAAVVYNPTKVDEAEIRRAIADEPGSAGWAPTLWIATTEDDPGSGQTKRALAEGASVVLAAGGDGTVRAVVEALADTDVPLAILPAGTGNLLARNLDLTIDDLAESVRIAFTGADRRIDVVRIDIRREDNAITHHAFVVMAGLGLDAKMLAKTDEELKARVGWLAYAQAIIRALRDSHQLRLRYSLDGDKQQAVRAHTLIVGNCGTLTGNIVLLPDAEVDDGLFDLVMMRPQDLLGWLQIVGKVFWENGVLRRTEVGRLFTTKDVHALRYLRGKELRVRFSKPEEIELDGDGLGYATAIKTWIAPGALAVRLPNQTS
ncbi:diacylglycerol/lipid kinase family protein [Diaminobutyricibacter sp. McL0608]|uniref:diacylglycerol/lipid kinase family protein n=1 Tax=Leifsonia sp. McL0608 TaxID=3143537 RepID=UPI0031F3100C